MKEENPQGIDWLLSKLEECSEWRGAGSAFPAADLHASSSNDQQPPSQSSENTMLPDQPSATEQETSENQTQREESSANGNGSDDQATPAASTEQADFTLLPLQPEDSTQMSNQNVLALFRLFTFPCISTDSESSEVSELSLWRIPASMYVYAVSCAVCVFVLRVGSFVDCSFALRCVSSTHFMCIGCLGVYE